MITRRSWLTGAGALTAASLTPGWAQASRALALFETTAHERGATRIFLEVAAANRPALRFYEKHGFGRDGLRRGYYPRPGGGRDDALLMSRALT